MDANLLILYATMTGNARDAVELLSERIAKLAGHTPRIERMGEFDPRRLARESTVLFVTSTFGNGDPPDNAFAFWDILRKADELRLAGLRYSVAALGDMAYPRFCQFGRDLDARLQQLGAQAMVPLATCDVDWEAPFEAWMEKVLEELKGEG
jgi:sulfite reductase (NADPH) flavoprotein alpha-component